MTAMLTLDLALITFGPDGIRRVGAMNLPRIDGVHYVVSWQCGGDAAVPASLIRPDISVCRTQSRGAAVNRNNAIAACTADIILFSDDDLIYTADQLKKVIATFENNPEVDLATFVATHPSGPVYPAASCRLGDPLPRGYWVSAYQIAYRRERIGNLLCHPEFGAGAPVFTGADDELFLLSAIRRGLHCYFFPINICTHPDLSTGTTVTLSPGNLRAAGCYITLAYPGSFILRIPLKAWRIRRAHQCSFTKALCHMFSGAAQAPRILRSDRRYLW